MRRSVLAALILLSTFLRPHISVAQQVRFSGVVVDEEGSGISHAEIAGGTGAILGVTESDGAFNFQEESSAPISVKVSALAYDTTTVTISPGLHARIVLQKLQEQIVVSAYRSPLDTLDSPANTRIVNPQQLQE